MSREGRGVGPMLVAEGVIGHDGDDGGAECGEPGDGVIDEGDRTRRRLIGQQFSIRDPRRIVHGNVQTLSARLLPWAAFRAVAGDAMPITPTAIFLREALHTGSRPSSNSVHLRGRRLQKRASSFQLPIASDGPSVERAPRASARIGDLFPAPGVAPDGLSLDLTGGSAGWPPIRDTELRYAMHSAGT